MSEFIKAWRNSDMKFYTMTETAVHKDDRAVFTQYLIRMTGQTWMVEPIAEASAEKEFPHQYFRLGILSTY